jgi:hypothetical protein
MDVEKGRRRVGHGDDRGGGGEPRVEPTEGVEDEGVVTDRRVVLGEGVGDLLLTTAILVDG